MTERSRFAYVTLLGTDDYIVGSLCLHRSLQKVNAMYPLVVLCSTSISATTLGILRRNNISYKVLSQSIITNHLNDGLYARWRYTFDKLQIFCLHEYEKIVFLDSDMYVVENIDHLFSFPHMSAVVADAYDQPGCNQLNSGLMVIQPSQKEYEGIIQLLENKQIKDLPMCGDQDLIRLYYSNWNANHALRLDNCYNMYFTNVKKYKWGGVSVLHFVYDKKPWQYSITALMRRLIRFNAMYLLRYMILVYRYKFQIIINAKNYT